jgi:hypothetical protein
MSTTISPPSSPPPTPPILIRESTSTSFHDMGFIPKQFPCVYCNEEFEQDASFKTACMDCYKDNVRECECGRSLRLGCPKYQQKCTTCWIRDRQRSHDKCPSCVGVKATHLRRKIGFETCSDCARKNKRQTKRVGYERSFGSRSRDGSC